MPCVEPVQGGRDVRLPAQGHCAALEELTARLHVAPLAPLGLRGTQGALHVRRGGAPRRPVRRGPKGAVARREVQLAVGVELQGDLDDHVAPRRQALQEQGAEQLVLLREERLALQDPEL